MTARRAAALVAIAWLALAACSGGRYRPARGSYNDGVAALAAGDWARARDHLLAARSEAGVDPELRWRAAYNLGLAYAGLAAEAEQPADPDARPDLERAIELCATAASWFQDALRLRSDDADARANLAVVRARQQALADRLLADERLLERRLERLIAAQRDVRDRARALLDAARAASGASPTALEDPARALATTERALLADAGVIVDLAGLELDGIAAIDDAQQTDAQRVRAVQLHHLELWMQVARTALGDARRLLDEGKLELAHGRADEAVEGLKRARDQLLDPIAVLRGIAGDQLDVTQQAAYLAHAAAEARKLEGGEPPPVPAWLTPAHLADRQLDPRSRLDEVIERLRAVQAAPADAAAPADPVAERLRARVALALPELERASAELVAARDALAAGDLDGAVARQGEALAAIARAIEQFLDLRRAIDVAWAEQGRIVALLDDGAVDVPVKERAREVEGGIARNQGRLALIAGLLADEVDALAAPADPAAGAAPSPEEVEARRATLARAEELRARAAAALDTLAAGGKRPPLEVAREGHDAMTELRTLFFSVIEHLQELVRDQGETRDDTAAAHALDDVGRAPVVPGIAGRQVEHHAIAQAIADALAEQADAAAAGAPGADPQQAERLGAAAEEVRAATAQMVDAGGVLVKVTDPQQTVSVDLQPALDAQQRAIEHLEAALRILQPPPPQEQDQPQDQDQDQDRDQQQQQQQQQQQDSVERRRERVREQEAQRRRERDQRQRADHDPVEKDW